jgi:hypothetical protein
VGLRYEYRKSGRVPETGTRLSVLILVSPTETVFTTWQVSVPRRKVSGDIVTEIRRIQMNRLVLRNTEHRKLSADEHVGSAHGKPRACEDLKVLLPSQLPQVEHTKGHRPSGVKADTVDHRPTGRRVRSPLALSRNSHGIRPAYVTQPAPFGPYAAWPYTTIGRVFTGTNPALSTWDWAGSGTLVGTNLLLTASHVVPWGAPTVGG